jgi:hypothetical protein
MSIFNTQKLDDRIEELEQQLAANDADANRYRWFRSNLDNDDALGNLFIEDRVPTPEELDVAIDKELGK